MPMYPYKCWACGHATEVFKPMTQYKTPEQCPECGASMDRVFTHRCASLDTPFRKPIEMFSVAPTNPAEVVALRRAMPDVTLTPQLVPVAHSRAEKLRILRATGCEEKA